jgi:hypothetical protein
MGVDDPECDSDRLGRRNDDEAANERSESGEDVGQLRLRLACRHLGIPRPMQGCPTVIGARIRRLSVGDELLEVVFADVEAHQARPHFLSNSRLPCRRAQATGSSQRTASALVAFRTTRWSRAESTPHHAQRSSGWSAPGATGRSSGLRAGGFMPPSGLDQEVLRGRLMSRANVRACAVSRRIRSVCACEEPSAAALFAAWLPRSS